MRCPDNTPGQKDWRWRNKCQGMFYSANLSTGYCPALGGHAYGTSGEYRLKTTPPLTTGQGEWGWCQKCQGLFYAGTQGFTAAGICPAGNQHDGTRV
jgi:hypothetical protein